jgi:Protein of unknown function (DUF4013)
MDYTKAFTFPQQDPDWIKKFVIAGALSIVPFVGSLLVAGYMFEITRRVVANNAQVMPEWTDWGNLFKKGLYVWVTGLVYALPLIVLALCSLGPRIAITMMANNSSSGSAPAGAETAVAIISGCFSCLVFLYVIFLGLVVPAALGKLAATDQLSSAFRFGEVIALVRAKPAVYVIILLISAVTASLLSSVGSIVCVVGLFWGVAYAQLVAAYLHGQAYLTASATA